MARTNNTTVQPYLLVYPIEGSNESESWLDDNAALSQRDWSKIELFSKPPLSTTENPDVWRPKRKLTWRLRQRMTTSWSHNFGRLLSRLISLECLCFVCACLLSSSCFRTWSHHKSMNPSYPKILLGTSLTKKGHEHAICRPKRKWRSRLREKIKTTSNTIETRFIVWKYRLLMIPYTHHYST